MQDLAERSCPRCGAAAEPGASFCGNCGAAYYALSTPETPRPARTPQGKKILTILGSIAFVLWKFKFAGVFVLSKLKFIVFGLTKLSTIASMLAFFGVYWAAYGWVFAAGIVVSIYLHEMGHVSELRKYGIHASAPFFIPGFGAFIMLKQQVANAIQDARVGLAGPLWGLGASVLAHAYGAATGNKAATAIGVTGAFINLFNLIPVWTLDGGRGFRSLDKIERLGVTGVIFLALVLSGEFLLVFLLLGAGYRLFKRDAPPEGDRFGAYQFSALVLALTLLSYWRPRPIADAKEISALSQLLFG